VPVPVHTVVRVAGRDAKTKSALETEHRAASSVTETDPRKVRVTSLPATQPVNVVYLTVLPAALATKNDLLARAKVSVLVVGVAAVVAVGSAGTTRGPLKVTFGLVIVVDPVNGSVIKPFEFRTSDVVVAEPMATLATAVASEPILMVWASRVIGLAEPEEMIRSTFAVSDVEAVFDTNAPMDAALPIVMSLVLERPMVMGSVPVPMLMGDVVPADRVRSPPEVNVMRPPFKA